MTTIDDQTKPAHSRRLVVGAAVAGTISHALTATPIHAKKGKKPSITLDATQILSPGPVQVSGKNFPSGRKVTITLSPGGQVIATAKASKKGKFKRNIVLPGGVPTTTGTYDVIASAKGGSATASLIIGVPTGDPVALGMFIPEVPTNDAAWTSVTNKIGWDPTIIMWFQAWGGTNSTLNTSQLDWVRARGATPMITWESFDPAGGVIQPAYRLDVLDTNYGAYIDTWAAGLAAWGHPVYLRWGHEMNGDWYPWAASVNGNTAADYVSFWNTLRGRFAAQGATNVQFVWCPNVSYTGSTPLADVFPGSSAVDWLAVDGYNWGSKPGFGGWKSFANVFGPTLAQLNVLAPGRPVLIGETASADGGGDKSSWIAEALLDAVPLAYPQIRALVWFDEDKECDWRVNSSPEALESFASAVANRYWHADAPLDGS